MPDRGSRAGAVAGSNNRAARKTKLGDVHAAAADQRCLSHEEGLAGGAVQGGVNAREFQPTGCAVLHRRCASGSTRSAT